MLDHDGSLRNAEALERRWEDFDDDDDFEDSEVTKDREPGSKAIKTTSGSHYGHANSRCIDIYIYIVIVIPK